MYVETWHIDLKASKVLNLGREGVIAEVSKEFIKWHMQKGVIAFCHVILAAAAAAAMHVMWSKTI